MHARHRQRFLALLLAVVLARRDAPAADAAANSAPDPKAAAAAEEAAKRDAKALGWLIQRGARVLVRPAAPDDQQQVDDQRRQQIEQHAKHMKQTFQPMLNGELELIRSTCGGLTPEGRQQILAAGREAVTTTARGFTERQFNGRLGQDDFDPRREIRIKLEQALGQVADPAALAAYRQEIERREARRAESARVAIVACVDRQLQLSAEQRSRIEEELERTWQPAWAADLGSRGDMRINGLPPAPDFAAAAIEPHLDRDQAEAWKKWRRQASSRNFGRHFQWHFDGQGLQQLDPWWGR
jgi:hypothetical protein